MYKIYADNHLLYDGIDESLNLLNVKLNQEINKTAIFNFEMYPSHINYDKPKRLKSYIKIYEGERLIYKGRFIDDTKGFYNQRQFTCESSLSFLVDSTIRPYEYPSNEEGAVSTVEGLLAKFISEHNSQVEEEKRFELGEVTVTDPNGYIVRANSEYENTLENIQKKLLDMLGGYLIIRYEDDGTYIDYLAEINTKVNQDIEFAVNLLDYKLERKGEEIFTGIIPLGATIKITDEQGNEVDTGERLTIADVNGGLDYLVDANGEELYGRIFETMIWDDVTDANNLMTKALVELQQGYLLPNSIELSAVDLAATGADVGAFEMGRMIKVMSKPHNLEDYYLINKLDRNLLDPSKDKLTLGKTFKTLTEQNKSENEQIREQITIEVDTSASKIEGSIDFVQRNLESEINAQADEIYTVVREEYWSNDEQQSYRQEMETRLSQTSEEVQIWFNSLEEYINNIEGTTNAEFELIQKYIRFVDGAIVLGIVGNELILKQTNDRISFLDDNVEVAYFSNKKLYVTDAHILKSLQIGQFAFYPQSNGSLSFNLGGEF